MRINGLYIFLAGAIVTCCDPCRVARELKAHKTCALVVEKHKVEWNRNSPIIEIVDGCSSATNFFTEEDQSGLWDYVQPGDSLFKEANSYKVFVHRKGEATKQFVLNFLGCD